MEFHLNMSFVSFCFVCHIEIFPKHGTSCDTLGTVVKPLDEFGAPSWFHNVSTYNGEVIKF
jgi:hypothetical protein